MKVLHRYINGNTKITLYDDGSRHRVFEGIAAPEEPDSIDVKITNYCEPTENNPICSFCHESSGLHGVHGDLDKLYEVLHHLSPGKEICIGGGNPLAHPNLEIFLSFLRTVGLVSNLTINQKHIIHYKDLILKLLKHDLIKGIGISYSDPSYLKDIKHIIQASSNVVFHMIMGINKVEDIYLLKSFCQENKRECKILILGYKQFGFGINYYLKNKKIENNKYEWYTRAASYFKNRDLILSFDNLAISQLNLQRYFIPTSWDEFYQGKDGQFSMYIDGVKQEFAISSTSKERKSFKDSALLEFFENIQHSSSEK